MPSPRTRQSRSQLGRSAKTSTRNQSSGATELCTISQKWQGYTQYGVRRSRFYERHPHDRRLKKKFASSRRERERVSQVLHRVSTLIVEKARANNEAIVLERLKGIRYAHKKGNGETKARRRRIALWSFRQVQATSGIHRLQGQVGWSPRRVRACSIHVKDMPRMRVHQQET